MILAKSNRTWRWMTIPQQRELSKTSTRWWLLNKTIVSDETLKLEYSWAWEPMRYSIPLRLVQEGRSRPYFPLRNQGKNFVSPLKKI